MISISYLHPSRPFVIVTRPLRSSSPDYDHEERFFYPAFEVGETVTLRLFDSSGDHFIFCYFLQLSLIASALLDDPPREVNMTTLSRQPKIFLLDGFLSHEVSIFIWIDSLFFFVFLLLAYLSYLKECDAILHHADHLPSTSHQQVIVHFSVMIPERGIKIEYENGS
jgi:hypothetical protein